ncbi:hypothetical protein [Bradyrhizobium sp. SSUT77]|uniref:hypothetical protein n=1 Tax=Bradyrhizobium sp. SSUT77 TaxID=3040603 RepID=UPI0024487518|nr:hypothetical protein [Bradyrhizobium sp. SSUT77]MDH2346808.1 hypothetical protein [Bradyrhizobium sp. SSUT77]
MELSYLSSRMREVAMDHGIATEALGPDLAQTLRSIIADMREAMYLGELADLPEIMMEGETVKLRFHLGLGTWLIVEPIGANSMTNDGWRQSHRVKLLDITGRG